MKIVNIFAYRLFAFHYDGEEDNEYSKLLDLWTDTEYVRDFLIENEADIPANKTRRQFVEYIREDAIHIDEQLIKITESDDESLSNFFRPLHNSEFQLKVWEMLLKIPMGQLATYGDIATQVGKPNASRAVGTAIGSNPIAFLIPCHRVIQSSGNTGGYMWGTIRKTAIIAWESAKCEMK